MPSFCWDGKPYTPKQCTGSAVLDMDPLAIGDNYGTLQQVPSLCGKDNQVVTSRGKWHTLLSLTKELTRATRVEGQLVET